MNIKKFSANEFQEAKYYYDTFGYVVLEGLLSNSKIDNLLSIFENKKRSNTFIFTSQDKHISTRPKLNSYEFLESSILNPSQLTFAPHFSRTVESCLTDKAIADFLSFLSGDTRHVMMQNMLFDKSTGTIEHQDHYYLDANPPGNMVAAWYSLEDIHEEAGCFFVLPGSHKGDVITRKDADSFSDHEAYRQEILKLIETSDYEYRPFPLKKGDVLFWHPYTIHGAYKNVNPKFSRKSLTAHFYPACLKSLYATNSPNLRQTLNPNILVDNTRFNTYLSNFKMYLRFVMDKVNGRNPEMVMRRESYEKEVSS